MVVPLGCIGGCAMAAIIVNACVCGVAILVLFSTRNFFSTQHHGRLVTLVCVPRPCLRPPPQCAMTVLPLMRFAEALLAWCRSGRFAEALSEYCNQMLQEQTEVCLHRCKSNKAHFNVACWWPPHTHTHTRACTIMECVHACTIVII